MEPARERPANAPAALQVLGSRLRASLGSGAAIGHNTGLAKLGQCTTTKGAIFEWLSWVKRQLRADRRAHLLRPCQTTAVAGS